MYQGNKRFNKVELLVILVVISGIASIVMPQFSSAANEARTSDLCDSLYELRSNITLYKMHHNNKLPGWGNDFVTAMTGVTDSEGNFVSSKMSGKAVSWGPYMEEIPVNVFNGMNTVRVDGEPAGAGTHGWRYDSYTGEIQADDVAEGHNIL